MDIYLILFLRTVHVVAAVCWVGGAIIHTVFIQPSVKATAPESSKFMQYFMGRQRFSLFMNVSSGLTILAGILLYWRASGGLQWPWIQSGPGLMFTIGSIVGIAVYFLGLLMIKPRVERLQALGQAIGAAGGPPSPAQVAELHKIDKEMSLIGRVDFVLLLFALLTMATARYWYV
jgi:uncharacterized membrane protein